MSDANQETQNQIYYIQRQIEDARQVDNMDRELLNAGYMKLHEYGPKHVDTMNRIERWEQDIADLEKKLVSPVDLEVRKRELLLISAQAKKYEEIKGEVPNEMKRALIKMAVTTIYVDSKTGMMRIEGIIGPQVRSFPADDQRWRKRRTSF